MIALDDPGIFEDLAPPRHRAAGKVDTLPYRNVRGTTIGRQDTKDSQIHAIKRKR